MGREMPSVPSLQSNMSPAARMSHSPPSTHEDEPTGTGLQSRSRNARAQARHRAKRKKYIETLEDTVKRLQTIVDAAGLDPNAFPPPMPSAHAHSHPYLRELQDDNARLRREADALRVQISALTAHVSAGSHVTSSLPMHYAPSPPPSDAHTPPPNSDRDSKKRRMSAERDHGPLYLDSHPQGRTSPASASSTSLANSNSSIHTQTASTSTSSLSMLSPLQQQVVYNSLFSGLGSGTNSTPSVSTGNSSQPSHASRPTSPPVPVSTFAQLPATTSLLATSLYPLLTLGIAGGAVSGELGAAAWNAFQQSQLAQQGSSNGQQPHPSLAGLSQLGHHQSSSGLGQNLGQSSLGQGLPGLHNPNPPSFMSHSQPMSTLSSSLESPSGLPSAAGMPRMDSGSTSSSGLRMDSPSGLPQSLESMRTSSPGTNSSSPPRFDSSRFESSTRFDPPGASRFDSASSLFDPPTNSPHLITGTPPGFGSSNSSTPGLPMRHMPEARRSSGSSRRDDVP
ncbi:hypothetical protein RSOLAG1IB_09009 [Rhizoctonia solani AG-1 IB]|uniref:BZIP domain-containing protein n=1 Tax=Thanatephorus cucumeris (strain AG1-IB / isolate 7/3/14) TaxID=1108050 RepID=A0A0B7FM27_THACB|nr:hypothetical protein RSOLAG1IB_09009 [Rhizoctonia solani AG-1 IB]